MYYPYLRGRQFELIALREFSESFSEPQKVIPIIEPVKNNFNSLNLALSTFINSKFEHVIIVNPQVGEIEDFEIILENFRTNNLISDYLIPAYIVNSRNIESCRNLVNESLFNKIMIIMDQSLDINSGTVMELIDIEKIEYIVSYENRSLRRKLGKANKKIIRLDDNFISQKKNSDFLDVPEEKFSEEHIFFIDEGYSGFSDFTVVTSDYVESGFRPYAVAIHITFCKDNKEIWIKHLTSTSNDDPSNIQGKFNEALLKAKKFISMQNIGTKASQEFVNCQSYPGLGTIKKWSIMSHLELVHSFLIEQML